MRVNFRNFHTVHFKNAGPSVGSCSSKRDRIFEQIWWPDHKSKYFTLQANDEIHHHHSVGDVTNAGIFNGYVLRFFYIHDRFHGKFTNWQHFIRTSYFLGQSLEEKQKQFEALKSLPFSDNPFFVRQIADSGKFEGKNSIFRFFVIKCVFSRFFAVF